MNKISQFFYKFQTIIKNFLSLFIIQGLNYILPLVTIPHIFNAIGVELFGVLAMATSFVSYFVIITNYGFQLSATKEISIFRENQDKLNEIFTSVFIIKFFLMLFSLVVIFLLVESVDVLSSNKEAYFCTSIVILGHLLFPVWYFQGIEKMKYLTYFTIFSKTLFTVLIFIYVRNEEDYLLVPIFLGIGQVVAGFFSLFFLFYKFRLRFSKINISNLFFFMKDGFHVFVGSLYSTIYTSGNVFLLGLFANPALVGFYSIAERIVSAVSGLFLPLNQAVFPNMAKTLKHNREKFFTFSKKMIPFILSVSISLFVLTILFSDLLVKIVSKESNAVISLLIIILAFRIISSPFGAFFSNILILLNKKKEYMRVMNITVVLNFIIVLPCIVVFKAYGLAISFVLLLYIHTLLLYKEIRLALQFKTFF